MLIVVVEEFPSTTTRGLVETICNITCSEFSSSLSSKMETGKHHCRPPRLDHDEKVITLFGRK